MRADDGYLWEGAFIGAVVTPIEPGCASEREGELKRCG